MTDERTLEILRLLLEHRIWDEVREDWIIEYDPLVDFLLGVPYQTIQLSPPKTYHQETRELPDGTLVTWPVLD